MNLLDGLRPKLAGGTPAYLSPSGRILGPLTALYVSPLADSRFEVGQHWLTGKNNASWFAVEVEDGIGLLALLQAWVDDPEGTMRERFGWSWQEGPSAPAPVQATASAEDMGL